jgi:hypothetical protein
MEQLDGNKILKLGKKHKKWGEDVTVEIFPYVLNSNRYYLAYYFKKFTREVKEIAIVSPDSVDRDEALEALKPLTYFTITFGKLEENTKARAELDYSIYLEIRDFLTTILESGLLSHDLKNVYNRSLKIMEGMIQSQEEMLELREKVNQFAQGLLHKGYFDEQDIKVALELFPEPGWIQYEQFYNRYQNRKDFDVIYENSSSPQLRQLFTFRDPKTLYNMTSQVAESQLMKSLDILTDSKDMSGFTKEDYFNYWTTKFKKGLADRNEELRKKIRYPKMF